MSSIPPLPGPSSVQIFSSTLIKSDVNDVGDKNYKNDKIDEFRIV